ncbi:hypothetical protein K6959_10985 [Bacillus aquiflavi]|uniref:hypothetical protein n=1 Tax=Bacillus aquiflavi TaxID=2672567 RepID=UPI001CA8D6C2|nr:hypothetical protein [Bacillus aquiflavi]UAC47249.1 hypothetical protein K6959_10985 [Bacillus aquiflavi]
MRQFMRFFIFFTGIFFVYRYRYQIMNIALGNILLRRMLVSSVMRVPGVRERMMQSIFR